jgi:hypothetical protein
MFASSAESVPSLAKIPAPRIAIPIVILKIFCAVQQLRDESGISFDSNSHLRITKSVGTKSPETPKVGSTPTHLHMDAFIRSESDGTVMILLVINDDRRVKRASGRQNLPEPTSRRPELYIFTSSRSPQLRTWKYFPALSKSLADISWSMGSAVLLSQYESEMFYADEPAY